MSSKAPETLSETAILAWVRSAHNAIYGDDEVGGGPIASFTWRYDRAFDTRREIDGLGVPDRAKWMHDEIETEADEELDRGWSSMADEDIVEPIILVIVDDKAYCWDGNHRIGSRCIGQNPFLPAIIGTPKIAAIPGASIDRTAA